MIIKDLPFNKYRDLEGVNKSTLDLINKSPGLVPWSIDCPEDTSKENAGVFGNAFHTLVLEPEAFPMRYIVAPKCDRRTKAGKEEYEAFKLELKGKTLLEQKEMHQLKLMHGSVMAHPEARKIIEAAHAAKSTEVTFQCNRGPFCTKSRHDIFLRKQMVSCDLKTIDPGNKDLMDAWGHSVIERRYDVQEAHYREDVKHELGQDLKAFYFIVVSKRLSMGRYETRVLKLTPDQLEAGKVERNKDVKRYLDCVKAGKWPGIETTVIPAYAKR